MLDRRRFKADIERALFALVANRALVLEAGRGRGGPRRTSRSPASTGWTYDPAYRALELLVEADSEVKMQETVFLTCADLLNLEVDLLFSDTTSTYFDAATRCV